MPKAADAPATSRRPEASPTGSTPPGGPGTVLGPARRSPSRRAQARKEHGDARDGRDPADVRESRAGRDEALVQTAQQARRRWMSRTPRRVGAEVGVTAHGHRDVFSRRYGRLLGRIVVRG